MNRIKCVQNHKGRFLEIKILHLIFVTENVYIYKIFLSLFKVGNSTSKDVVYYI